MPVAEAQVRVSSREFAEWRAYDLRDPIGSDRSDLMLSIVAQTVANFSGRVKRPLKHTDFLPKYGARKRQSAGDIMNRLKLAASLGAEAKRLKDERAKIIADRKQAKQNKDQGKKPDDHGQRGNRQRKVHRSDRSI